MKKDINFKLIALTILLLLSFTAFLVYFQSNIISLSDNVENKSQTLEQVTAYATKSDSISQQLDRELKKTKEDYEALNTQYIDISSKKAQLEKELTLLKQQYTQIALEKDTTQGQLDTLSKNYNILETRYNEFEKSLSEAYITIGTLESQKDELCSRVKGTAAYERECV